MVRKSMATATLTALLLSGGALGITGCEREGPAERAGEKVDRAVDDLKDAVDPAGPAEKAGREVDRAVDDATE